MSNEAPPSIEISDRQLIQIIDHALSEAADKCGPWLACRPGCSQCCTGVFPINQLDAQRLRRGYSRLRITSPERATRLGRRVADSIDRLSRDFPGDPRTGLISNTPEDQERFAGFGNAEVCPVLDPDSQTCDLYQSRPVTCRVFGPPVRSEEGIGVCELCFQGAAAEEIAACEVFPDPEDLESQLLAQLDESGQTIVAFALQTSVQS